MLHVQSLGRFGICVSEVNVPPFKAILNKFCLHIKCHHFKSAHFPLKIERTCTLEDKKPSKWGFEHEVSAENVIHESSLWAKSVTITTARGAPCVGQLSALQTYSSCSAEFISVHLPLLCRLGDFFLVEPFSKEFLKTRGEVKKWNHVENPTYFHVNVEISRKFNDLETLKKTSGLQRRNISDSAHFLGQ